ncbi:MAG: hypothetical protein H0X26_00860 [Alphaproteobacteria bacterium]|nr:hypothetical protein [Alphaproteobacteria bacterium]
MKCFGIMSAYFLMLAATVPPVNAQTLTVGNVRVSVKADSAASAQAQALDQAPQLAFQKLVAENFPQSAGGLPSSEVLRDMVDDFSVDREKTTPTSYAASLTFQFNERLVQSWLHRGPQGSASATFGRQPYEECNSLNVTATYATHGEWQHIRKTVENFPDVQSLSVFTLSPKNANVKITYRGAIDKLKQGFLQNGILLTQQEDGWMVSSSELGLH